MFEIELRFYDKLVLLSLTFGACLSWIYDG